MEQEEPVPEPLPEITSDDGIFTVRHFFFFTIFYD
jgi:hypothetical protein